jgi:hypothetical protein
MPTAERALVRNAADPQQVRRAGRKVDDREDQFAAALATVMSTTAGRLVFAELLERAGLYQTVFDHSGSVMYFREGRRNFGLEIQAALVAADDALYDTLERERRARQRQDDRETAATHTRPAGTGETDG